MKAKFKIVSPLFTQALTLLGVVICPFVGVANGLTGGNSKLSLLYTLSLLPLVLASAALEDELNTTRSWEWMLTVHDYTLWLMLISIIATYSIGLVVAIPHPGAVFATTLPLSIYGCIAMFLSARALKRFSVRETAARFSSSRTAD